MDISNDSDGQSEPEIIPPRETRLVDQRTVFISAWAMVIALGAGLLAQVLIHLIGLFTNIAFYHRLSIAFVDPASAHSGWLTLLFVPVVVALIVGALANCRESSRNG